MKQKTRRSFGKKALQTITGFVTVIKHLSFKEISDREKLKTMVSKGLKKPKRATVENALQRQFKFKSKTRYASKILTGIFEKRFSRKGSTWVHVEDEQEEVVFRREFYRINAETLVERLLPYAKIARNIAESKPKGMKLIEISETEYEWRGENGKSMEFHIADYFWGLTEEERAFVLKNESKRNSYLRRTEGKVTRQRDIQKTWK